MNIIDFNDFKEETKLKEGIVIMGAGGNIEEWITGITNLLKNENIVNKEILEEELFTERFLLKTSGGRRDLALVTDFNKVNMGMFAMWRLKFGSCSWISDYKENYSNQF